MAPQPRKALPGLGDPIGLAEQRKSFEGSFTLARFDRLGESLADNSGEAYYRMNFSLDASGSPRVAGDVKSAVKLVCQRCLDTLEYPIERAWDLILIEDPAEERMWSEEEDLYLVTGEMRLSDLIEDELILALPLVPRHADESCQAPAEHEDRQPVAADSTYPFAALSKLKRKL